VSAYVADKALMIIGTTVNDVISATRKSSKIMITSSRPLTLGAGCSWIDGVATCKATRMTIDGAAGGDTLTIGGSPKATVIGGAGNDRIVSGKSRDVFAGGAGDDTVDCSARVGQKITGTPGTGPDDGKRGEKDDIQGDIEHVMFPPAASR
jgi:Ca2+-binding RTX toxin-like protein